MAGYVSSYPTLWSVSDMLSVREEGRQAENRGRKGGLTLTVLESCALSLPVFVSV